MYPLQNSADIISCSHSLRSYAKNAQEPIDFFHYTHVHPQTTRVTYPQRSAMCTLYIFLEGKFGFLVKDEIYNPGYGDVIVFRGYEQFTSVFYTNSHVDYYQINFPAEFFTAMSVPALFCTGDEANFPHMLVPESRSRALILEKLKQTEEWILYEDPQRDLLAYANLLQILSLLSYRSSQRETAAKVPIKLQQALEYIHSNFTTLTGIDEIASFCDVTATYLSRMFRESFGCTPNTYLNNLRISQAKYLLSSGSTLTEACYRSGFNNYTYFISKFKSSTGITPAKFKTEMVSRGL